MQKFATVLFLAACLATGGCGSPSTSTTATAAACGSVPPEYVGKTNPLGPGSASACATAFQANCVACHGPSGKGDGPAASALNPPPADLAKVGEDATDDRLLWHISNGVPGSAMPAWKGVLTDEQIWQVIS